MKELHPRSSIVATFPRRRFLGWATAGLPAMGLFAAAGCSTPGPPPVDYRLPLDAPEPRPQPTGSASSTEVWQLPRTVRLPDYLDRDRLQLPTGATAMASDAHARWAEPLREAIPRILQHDLAAWLHTQQVWLGAPPAGWPLSHRLELEIQAFEAEPARSAVRLLARWSISPTQAGLQRVLSQADLRTPVADKGIPGIVQAHRLALWQLAQRIAQSRL